RLDRARAEDHLGPGGAEAALAAVEHVGPERQVIGRPVLLPFIRKGGGARPCHGGFGRDRRSRLGRGRCRPAFLRDRKEIRAEERLHLHVALERPGHFGAPWTNLIVSSSTTRSASSIVPRNVAPDARGWPPPPHFDASTMPSTPASVRHDTLIFPGSSVSRRSTATRTPLIDFTWSMYSWVSPGGKPVVSISSLEITIQPTLPSSVSRIRRSTSARNASCSFVFCRNSALWISPGRTPNCSSSAAFRCVSVVVFEKENRPVSVTIV